MNLRIQEAALTGEDELRHMLLTAVSVAVAIVPEGLPAVVLALGAQRMLKQNALIRILQIETVASEAALSEPSFKRVRKAKKVTADMVATIAFFWVYVRAKVSALCLDPNIENVVIEKLIPAIYLRHASKNAKSADIRQKILKQSEHILHSLQNIDSPFIGLEPEKLALILKVSEECACLFQRPGSCVEGRNGQLSLRHHSLHRLSNRKLTALTTVHNYFIKRNNGTTPAERFFTSKPRDLF